MKKKIIGTIADKDYEKYTPYLFYKKSSLDLLKY